jgi:hypothetical protein
MHVTWPGPQALGRLRAVAFALATLWIVGGPFYTQILHGKPPAFAWHMFGTRGLDMVEARFERARPDGTRASIERTRVLGYASLWDAPRAIRRIQGEAGLRQAVAELCAKLGPGTDLRVHARLAVAGGDGWRVLDDGMRNACAGRR